MHTSALNTSRRNPAVDGAIVGFRSPSQVDPIVAAVGLELSQEDLTTTERGVR